MAGAEHVPLYIADDLIMIAAFRYALDRQSDPGRQSYTVAHVASWIDQHAGQIRDSDARLIIREIDEQAEQGSFGTGMNERRWRCLQARLHSGLAPALATLAGGQP